MWVSIKRLQQFFKLPDRSSNQLYDLIEPDGDQDEIRCVNADFSAQTSAELLSELNTVRVLRDITLSIRSGQFIGVTGRIGSGKTSLLNSLMGELHKTSGQLAIQDHRLRQGFGYAPQV